MSKIDEIKARLEAMEPYIKASSIGEDIAWLISEVDRLKSALGDFKFAQKETIKERDRFRAALEQIATPDELSIDALTVPWKDAINKRIEIAREALKKP